MSRYLKFGLLLALIVLSGCSRGGPAGASSEAGKAVLPPIEGGAVMEHIRVLASDEFEGRAPGTRGEGRTVAYLTEQMRKIGLEPGNPDGTYVQKVPLTGTTVLGSPSLAFSRGAKRRALKWHDDYVAWTKRVAETSSLEASEVVFVGYGVEAPEFQWDDFKGADLRGKTMLVLVGDPPVPDPNRPGELDPALFGGRAMTYYGRWTYKYEMGAKLGAAGVLIVHETPAAGYPFAVIQGKTAEQFDLRAEDRNMGRAAVEGWITLEQARQLCSLAGLEYDALKRRALGRDFRPVPLGVSASVTLKNAIRTVESQNVVGKLPGADPALRDEFVVYTSHWDHFGIGAPVNGDRIYNGARDNATGVGGVLEIARTLARVEARPKRSILFLFVTAEEQGLLGSAYYATHPLYPPAKTLAVINLDGLNVWGRTRDMTVVGLGLSELDDAMQEVASAQGRVLRPDPEPERGSYYRSDHFPFAKRGIPSINAGGGDEYVDRPADYGKKMREDYTVNHYHKPSDDVKADWDLSGALQDLEACMALGYKVAQASKFPNWKPSSEFKR